MARRCFERLDAEGIDGTVSVLRVLSETDNVAHAGRRLVRRRQGPLGPRSSARRTRVARSAATIRSAHEARVRLLVGERPVGRLEDEVQRDRLPPLPDLVAAVDVEDARLAELGASRLARDGDDRPGLDVLGDDDRDVLAVRPGR